MQKHIGWLWIVGFFALLPASGAQNAAPPSVNTQFDGTYAFVSQTNVNETFFTAQTEHVRRCLRPPLKTEPLTVVNGEARYTSPKGLQFEGTVGPQGELTMRVPPAISGRCGGCGPGIEETLYGRIGGNGMIRGRRTGYNCSYDIVFQKEPK